VCNAGGVIAAEPASRNSRLRAGLRAGVPFAVAAALLSVSFGIVAPDAGMSQLAAILMSAIVFAGSAQFTAIAILSQGGTLAAAIGAAALINSR
jgi:predicted branched-subunit amino acid permease